MLFCYAVANVLFLDSPVGVGYSYTNNSNDLLSNGDQRTGNVHSYYRIHHTHHTFFFNYDEYWFSRWFIGISKQLATKIPSVQRPGVLPHWRKLCRFVENYPHTFNGFSFFILILFGLIIHESGHYVPQLAQAIYQSNNLTGEKSINLIGYMVGNALTDDYHDHIGVFQFMWTSGLISDQTYNLSNLYCDSQSFIHTSPQCDKILDIGYRELGNIDPYSIFTPTCSATSILSRNKVLKKLRVCALNFSSFTSCIIYFKVWQDINIFVHHSQWTE